MTTDPDATRRTAERYSMISLQALLRDVRSHGEYWTGQIAHIEAAIEIRREMDAERASGR